MRSFFFIKYAVFSGRARRSEYWGFYLINFLITLVLMIIVSLGLDSATIRYSSPLDAFGPAYILIWIYSLAICLPSLAVTIRRLHDIGKSGFWFFIGFIPMAGAIILLVFMCTEGQRGDNDFGPDPKDSGSNTEPGPGEIA